MMKLHYYDRDGKKHNGHNPQMTGDCSGLEGNCSGLKGNCSGLRGDCSGLEGNCSGLEGNIPTRTNDIRKLMGK